MTIFCIRPDEVMAAAGQQPINLVGEAPLGREAAPPASVFRFQLVGRRRSSFPTAFFKSARILPMVLGMVSADQQQVLNFLRSSPNSYFSATEVSRKAGSRKQFEEDPRWAINCLRYLVDMKLIVRDTRGHYKFATDEDKRNEKAESQPGH